MGHERALSALRDAGTALNDLEAERVRLVESLALAAEAGVADDKYIAQLEAEIAALKARIAELEAHTCPTDPPIIVDPPPPTTGAPDFSSYGFAHLMPVWRQHAIPTEAQCDWVIDGAARIATSRKGLPNVAFDPATGVAGTCYKHSINAGHGPRVTIGVRGNAGNAWVGGMYDTSGGGHAADICRRAQDGTWIANDVQFVGLTPDAEVALTWGGPFGFTSRVALLGMGLTGQVNNHALTQNKRCGEVILDDFWVLPPIGRTVDYHAMLHLANWNRLVIRSLKRKGRNGEAPLRSSGHIPYLKHSDVRGSETWVMDCDLKGANQTNMQKRPGKDEAYLTAAGQDVLVVANNHSDGYGWDHETFGGGSALSHWSSPHALSFYVGNRITDARGGCLVVSGQPLYNGQDRNWYDAQGYPIGEVYVDGNVFENPRGDRHCVSLSNAKRVHWGDRNRVVGRMVLTSEWIAERQPVMPRGNTTFVGARSAVPTTVLTYDAAQGREVPMTAAQIDAICLPAWPVPVGL